MGRGKKRAGAGLGKPRRVQVVARGRDIDNAPLSDWFFVDAVHQGFGADALVEHPKLGRGGATALYRDLNGRHGVGLVLDGEEDPRYIYTDYLAVVVPAVERERTPPELPDGVDPASLSPQACELREDLFAGRESEPLDLSFGLDELAQGFSLSRADVEEWLQDGRNVASLLEERLGLELGLSRPFTDDDHDLRRVREQEEKVEVRCLTGSGLRFAPSNQIGSGREFEEAGFLAKLDAVEGFLVCDVRSHPIRCKSVPSGQVRAWWRQRQLQSDASLSADAAARLLDLPAPASATGSSPSPSASLPIEPTKPSPEATAFRSALLAGKRSAHTLEFGLDALASGFGLEQRAVACWLQSGRNASGVLERRLARELDLERVGGNLDHDLAAGGKRVEVRCLTQHGLYFNPAAQVGSSREFDEEAFLTRLQSLDAFVVCDVTAQPVVCHSLPASQVLAWWQKGTLSRRAALDADKAQELLA